MSIRAKLLQAFQMVMEWSLWGMGLGSHGGNLIERDNPGWRDLYDDISGS
jgi:hypothetical protein